MSAMSDYLERQVLRHLLRNTDIFAAPDNVYVSLHTANPTDAASGAEVSGGSYARVAATTGTAGSGSGSTWTDPGASGTINSSNASAITFPAPTANWGTVTHFGVWDASTAGNLLFYGALTTSRTINNGDGAPNFPIGSLVVEAQ